jgi:catechol 2,3-dioxygenase-like lactoylglutathione lyase family enzyme
VSGFTGLHHTALITRDIERTASFWSGTLGLPLTQRVERDGFKHWFFELTETESIAFFEYEDETPNLDEFKMPGRLPTDGRQLDHLALGVEDEEALLSWHRRLTDDGVAVRGPVDHGIAKSIYFEDPNGISLEVCCWA